MNATNKVTIKMKLSDEDYHDIVLDWSDESCEYKQQLFMRKVRLFNYPIYILNTKYMYCLLKTACFIHQSTD